MGSVFQLVPRAARLLIGAGLVWLALDAASSVARAAGAGLVPVPQLGLRVASGFRVTLFANESLADDIYALALNARGEVVVTGRGYIRTLLDDNGDGVADRAVDYANTPSGGMGLCFDGDDLMFVGDGAVWRFQDLDRDRQADAAPERIMTLAGGEHGGHAVRKGPDGAWYVIGGNDSQFQMIPVAGGTFPPGKVEGGALLRLGALTVRWVAQGFRNPYDFDWNADGDLFTYDSDVERDSFLPWYLPTRVYHIEPGGHHGWRLEGYKRSWPRPGRYVDVVDSMAMLGRGSPTGVACYRHIQFPEYYQGGFFLLDWTFGRVYFVPIEPNGGTYRGTPEIFLESMGTEGFAPTDLAVGFDGSLYVSTGGRSTRGGVYRIQFADPQRQTLAAGWRLAAESPIQVLMNAPQPLEAWSRAVWRPEAERIDLEQLQAVTSDNRLPTLQRIRLMEVLTEVRSGLSPAVALACAQSAAPEVRARVAWSLGMRPQENSGPLLLALAKDNANEVRLAALETLRQLDPPLDVASRQQALAANLGHADKRVRQAAARLAVELPEAAWNALWKQQESTGVSQSRLTTILALLWRDGFSQVHTAAVHHALSVLTQTRAPEFREQALRLIFIGLGDAHLEKPSVELYTAYEAALPLADYAPLTTRLNRALVALLPSGDRGVDAEAARLLAVIESNDPAAPGKIIANCTPRSEAAADFHFLTAFSRLRAATVTNFTGAVVTALIGMDRKLDANSKLPRQNWTERLVELTAALIKHDPKLAEAMWRQSDFGRPTHLALIPLVGSDRYVACARTFLAAVNRNKTFPWDEPLVDLLASLPAEETHPLFRRQLENASIRDRLLLELAAKPQPSDRDYFVAGLASPRPEVVRASMTALLQLPNDAGNKTSIAVLRVLRGLLSQPKEQTARAQAVALLGRLAGQKFNVEERGPEPGPVYQPVFTWFETKYPGLSRQLDADDNETPAQWETRLQTVPWNRGDSSRGQTLYALRGCQNCHDDARALGPELAGVGQRYSPSALLRTIIFPSREIAPAYRSITFHMRDRQNYTGLVAFESADGVILRTGASATVRLATADILSREASTVSFMPSGLLTGFTGQDLADLYAYLKGLPPPSQ